jgi:hypothetical protein
MRWSLEALAVSVRAPHPDASFYAAKFLGRYLHGMIPGGIVRAAGRETENPREAERQ